MHAAVFDVFVCYLRDSRSVRHASDEEQRCENHPGFNSYSEIGKHCKPERNQPHADVGFGELEQLRNLAPLAHVVGDDHQDPRQRGHGDVASQRRSKQQHA